MRGLRYRIAFGYMVIVLIGLATSVFAVYNFSVVNRSVGSIIEENYQMTLATQNMVRQLERQENAQLSMILDDVDLAYVQFATNRVGFLGWLEKARTFSRTSEDLALLDSIARNYRKYSSDADSLYRLLIVRGQTSAATSFKFKVVRPLAESLKEDCFRVLDRSQDAISRTERTIRETTQGSMLTMILASILSISLSFVASVQFMRSLRPMERLTASVRRIGSGHLSEKIDVVATDEIGVLSAEFNKMTERLRRYEEMNIHTLIAEKKKSETIVASIADPVIVTDERQRVLLMNAAAEGLFGFDRSRWVGKPLQAVIGDERWMDQLLGRSPGREDDLLTIERSGRTSYYRPRRTVITDEVGQLQGTVTLLQDVTRFKDLDRMKSEFMATVSHELRTPLTSLNMSVDILLQEVLGALTERQREIITASKDDVDRLRKLVHDLLNLSRLEAGRQEMHRENVRLLEEVEEALRPLRLLFTDKKIELDVAIAGDLPPVAVDRRQFSWVVTNLVNNALRFTEPGGRVQVSARREPDAVVMAVSDTGRGIAPEHLDSIFDKFVQVHDTGEPNPGSVGLGLAIARGVVEAHGGRIWAESRPDHGSTFTFTIPIP